MSRQIYSLLPLAAWVPLPDREPCIVVGCLTRVNADTACLDGAIAAGHVARIPASSTTDRATADTRSGQFQAVGSSAHEGGSNASGLHNKVAFHNALPTRNRLCIIGPSTPTAYKNYREFGQWKDDSRRGTRPARPCMCCCPAAGDGCAARAT